MALAQLLATWTLVQDRVSVVSPDFILLVFRTSETMLEPSVVLYIYHGICRQLYPNDDSCVDLSNYPDRQDNVQEVSAHYITWYRFLWNLPALGLTLFCGSWSDKVGRKLVLILPCLGTIITTVIYLVSTIKRGYYLPMVLCGAVIRGTFGGTAVLLMAVQSYVSDITSITNRTWRFGVLLAMNYFGNVLGYVLMGIVLKMANFEDVFVIVCAMQSFCIFWALLFIRDRLKIDEIKSDELQDSDSSEHCFKSLFKLQHLRESLQVVTKKREDGARRHLCMLLLGVIINQIGREVEGDILVLYVERRPLNWHREMYGYLAATDFSVMGLLVCVALPLLSYRFHVPDMYLVVLGIAAKIIRLVLLSFSTKTWMVYVAVLVGSLIAITVSALKALVSKLVLNTETGKTFSIVSFSETLSSLFGSLVFSNLYAATASVFPGFSFLLTAFLYFILLVVMVYLTNDMLTRPSYGNLEEEMTDLEDETPRSTPRTTPSRTPTMEEAQEKTILNYKDPQAVWNNGGPLINGKVTYDAITHSQN